MRHATLTLIKSKTPDSIRHDCGIERTEYEGHIVLGPSVGNSFAFYITPKRISDPKWIKTSAVKNVQYVDEKTLNITTQNSEYKLSLGETFNG